MYGSLGVIIEAPEDKYTYASVDCPYCTSRVSFLDYPDVSVAIGPCAHFDGITHQLDGDKLPIAAFTLKIWKGYQK